jgi:hypothetical protein
MIEMARFQAFDLSINQITLESITKQNFRHPDCGKILRMHVPHQKPARNVKSNKELKIK